MQMASVLNCNYTSSLIANCIFEFCSKDLGNEFDLQLTAACRSDQWAVYERERCDCVLHWLPLQIWLRTSHQDSAKVIQLGDNVDRSLSPMQSINQFDYLIMSNWLGLMPGLWAVGWAMRCSYTGGYALLPQTAQVAITSLSFSLSFFTLPLLLLMKH